MTLFDTEMAHQVKIIPQRKHTLDLFMVKMMWLFSKQTELQRLFKHMFYNIYLSHTWVRKPVDLTVVSEALEYHEY